MAQKKIVITVSKQFPKTKGRCGEPTRFREKLATGEKIHTIRRNFDLWRVNSEKMDGQALSNEAGGNPTNP